MVIACKHDVIDSLSTASIMGCHCKHRIQTKKKKNQCNWELFNASMMINVDILTDYKQSKFMKINSNNGLFPFYPDIRLYNTRQLHSVPFKGYFLMKRLFLGQGVCVHL